MVREVYTVNRELDKCTLYELRKWLEYSVVSCGDGVTKILLIADPEVIDQAIYYVFEENGMRTKLLGKI